MLYQSTGKHILDRLVAAGLLVLLSPILVLIYFLVRTKLGSPSLFRQQRAGLFGQTFTIYKFRTMSEIRDRNGILLPDQNRLTPFGQFLRSTSLDELPELINVLKGEMSLVGPRPLLIKYLDRYTPEQMRRQEVRPGITGWAQVNGRNAISWQEKFNLDIWYVDNLTLQLDIRIIFMTIAMTVNRKGINQPGQATAEEFKGNLAVTGKNKND